MKLLVASKAEKNFGGMTTAPREENNFGGMTTASREKQLWWNYYGTREENTFGGMTPASRHPGKNISFAERLQHPGK